MRKRDLTNQRFGRLTALARIKIFHKRLARWRCICDCGTTKLVRTSDLVQGKSTSCGCKRKENFKYDQTTHGHAAGTWSPTYHTYAGMIKRCYYPASISYPYYGARGITVCDRWQERFENFLTDMGERPEGTSLDRIDPEGHYEPINCRWATPHEQRINQRPRKSQK